MDCRHLWDRQYGVISVVTGLRPGGIEHLEVIRYLAGKYKVRPVPVDLQAKPTEVPRLLEVLHRNLSLYEGILNFLPDGGAGSGDAYGAINFVHDTSEIAGLAPEILTLWANGVSM